MPTNKTSTSPSSPLAAGSRKLAVSTDPGGEEQSPSRETQELHITQTDNNTNIEISTPVNTKKDKIISSISEAKELLFSSIIDSFGDESGDAWTLYNDALNDEEFRPRFASINSAQFTDWLRLKLILKTGKPVENWIEPLIKTAASRARRNGTRRLYIRACSHDGAFWFHLNEKQVLEIRDGTTTLRGTQPLFRSYPHQAPLEIAHDAEITDLDLLDKYLYMNVSEKELFKTVIATFAIPGIAKPITSSRGPPGSSKSTSQRMIKELIDPSRVRNEGSEYPKNEKDWFVRSQQHYIVLLDNIGRLTKYQQDELSRMCTGRTLEARKLFTDNTLLSAHIRIAILVNAIDLSNLQSDYLDRSLLWDMQRIPDDVRAPEETLWETFKEDAPRIRGAIFKLIAAAQTRIDDIRPPGFFRLADFARWATAIAEARGISAEEFHQQLELKAELQRDESITQSQLAEPLITFMSDKDQWEGTAKELLKLLTEQEYGVPAGELGNEYVLIKNVPKTWFKSPEGLGKELTHISWLLPRIGLTVERPRTGKSRKIIFRKKSVTTVTETSRQKNLKDIAPLAVTGATKNSKTEPSQTVTTNDHTVTDDSKVTDEYELTVTEENVYKGEIQASEQKVTVVTEDSQKDSNGVLE